MQGPKQIVLLDDVTATTTGGAVNVENAKKFTVVFTRSNHSSGSSAFALQGSVDGVTFVTLAFLRNLATTNAETLARDTSVTLSSDTSVMVFLDEFIGLKLIRATVTETTDGTHRCVLFIN